MATVAVPRSALTRPDSLGLWIGVSGLVYVAAWIVGLVVAPGAPGINDTAGQITAYYAEHHTAAMVQTYLLDCVAGAAFLVFAVGLGRRLRDHPLGDLVMGAGIAAGAISLGQAALGAALANHVARLGSAPTVRGLFDAYNAADSFKLVAIALCVGAASLVLRRRTGALGAVLVPLLLVGGLGFLANSEALYAVLFVALPVLLVWVGAVSVVALKGR